VPLIADNTMLSCNIHGLAAASLLSNVVWISLQDKGFIRDAVLQSYKDQIDEDKAEEFLQKIVQVGAASP
jgi:hypothetical protein